jgi:hypothetical protein
MSSIAAVPTLGRPHIPNRRNDRVFFSLMVLLLLAAVLWGFGHTYFFAGMVAAPLPNKLIHFHGAVFTGWMVLLIVQTAFISTRHVQWHRKLGMFGFCWAILMLCLGWFAAVNSMRRGTAPLGLDPLTFFIISVSDLLLFALFIAFAYRWRSNVEAHKRLILIATIALADAAMGKRPIAALQQHPPYQDFVTGGFLLPIVLYDLFQLHRFSKTTLWASAVLMAVHLTRVPIGLSHGWHAMVSHLL